jgi:hypothetical protein
MGIYFALVVHSQVQWLLLLLNGFNRMFSAIYQATYVIMVQLCFTKVRILTRETPSPQIEHNNGVPLH